MGMESIFMELILRFTTKVTGRMTQKTVRDDYFSKTVNIPAIGITIRNMARVN